MKFINRGDPKKIRIGDSSDCYWKTIKRNEIVELPEIIGIQVGLTEVTDSNQELPKTTTGKLGDKVVETKQFEENFSSDGLFLKELQSIKGIGPKQAKDIVVWGTKEKLIEQIKLGNDLPFRDDVVEKLRSKYG